MISYGLKMLKRAIEERPKGGMQTGMPKITMREADAVRSVAELEWAQQRIAELESNAVPDGYITIPAESWHEQMQIEQELSATVERLRNSLQKVLDDSEIGVVPKSHLDSIESLLAATPQQNLNALKREIASMAFICGAVWDAQLIVDESTGFGAELEKASEEYANTRFGG